MSPTPTLDRVSDYVAHHAAVRPDHVAIIAHTGSTTYAELSALVDQHARALWAAGVRPGDRVALMANPSTQFFVSFFATASIGAIWLGLNPRYSARELRHVVQDSDPSLVLCALPAEERSALDRACEGKIPVVSVETMAELARFNAAGTADETDLAAARADVRGEQPALIVYTSGSTGTPKGALIRHSGLVRLGQVQSRVWALDDLVLVCNLPINHIGCVGDLTSVPIVAGATVVLRESFHAAELLADIAEHRITALFQIPTQLQRLCALPEFDSSDISSLQLIGWGGSPLPLESLARFRARGCRVLATYGMTEATSSITYTDPDASDEVLLNTVGRPDPGMRVRLLDHSGNWTVDGEGEVCIKNDTLMAGYLNLPEATAEAYTGDGWLRTGDIGTLRDDGNLVLVGRLKDMFKSGGYNIYPREIETVLESHPAVRMAAVVGRPDPDFHEVGVAYVKVDTAALTGVEELRDWCRAHLANFKVPKQFVTVDELPLLPVGKIDKPALRAQAAQLTLMGSTHA